MLLEIGEIQDVSRPITELPQQTTCVSSWEFPRAFQCTDVQDKASIYTSNTEPLSTLDLKTFTHVYSKLENVVLSGVGTPCSRFPSHVLWSCPPGFGDFALLELLYRLRSTRSDDGRNSRTRRSELQLLPQLADHDSIALEHVE